MLVEDLGDDPARIAVPTLVLGGEHDRVEPSELVQREVAARIPRARFAVLPRTGHLAPLEIPDLVATAITELTTELSPGVLA